MKRLLIALALAGGVAVSGDAAAQSTYPRPGAAPQRPHVLTHVPGNTNGGTFEVTTSTNFAWEADAWNMARAPEDTSQAIWQDSGATHTASYAAGPYPGTRATRVTSDSAAATTHSLTQTVIGPAAVTTYTYSVYAKWLAGNQYAATRVGNSYCTFNIVTGAAGTCLNGATGRIEAAGTGWWRISTTGVSAGVASTATYLALASADGTTMTFNGDGVTSALFYGPQLIRDSTWRPYVSQPLPSTISNPTRFEVATSWVPAISGGKAVTVVADQVLAPDGTMTADAVTFSAVTADNTYASLRQASTSVIAGPTYTFSVWARLPSGTSTLPMHLINTAGTPYFGNTACPITSEWTLCTLSGTPFSGGTVSVGVGAVYQTSNSMAQTQPAQTVYLWGARLTRSDQPAETFAHVTAGNVTSVTPLYPGGFANPSRFAHGPLVGASNRITHQGSQPDVGDLYDFRACVGFTLTSGGVQVGLIGDGNVSTAGHQLVLDASNACYGLFAATTLTTANTAAVGGPNVCCYGRQGTTGYVRLNNGATVSGAVTTPLDTTRAFYVASLNAGATPLTTGYVHGLIVDNDAWTEAWATKQIDRFLGRVDAHATPLSVTRTTTETYEIPTPNGQTLWTAPAGAPALGPDGIGAFRPDTNYGTNSADLSAWLTSGACSVVTDQGPAGFTDLDRPNCTGIYDTKYVTGTLTSTTGPVTGCMTVAAVTGTTTLSITGYTPGTNSVVSCWRSDGGACTPGILANVSYANATVGTTPTRLCVTWAASTAQTTWSLGIHDNPFGTGTGTNNALGGRASVIVGTQPMPYIATAAAAAQRSGDFITTPNKITAQDTTWCASGVWTPYARAWARTDGVTNTLWSTGTYGAANSGRVEVVGGGLYFTLVGGAGTASQLRYDLGTLTGSRTVRACIADGRQALYVDGALAAAGKLPTTGDWQTSPPAAWTTVPATWALGARGDTTAHFDGYVKDFKVENTAFTKADLDALDARLAVSVGSFTGPLIEDDANTTFHWVASEWNMARFPEALTNTAAWNVVNAATIAADQAVAPNGTLTADKLTNGGSASGAIGLTLTLATSTTYTLSLWGLASNDNSYDFGLICGADSWRTPSAVGTISGPGSTALSTNYGRVTGLSTTAWTRSYITVTTGATVTTCVLYVYPDNSASTTTGNAVFIWGAQVVRGSVPLPYKSPVTQNLLTSPIALHDSAKWLTSGGVSVTADQIQAPDLTLTADKVVMPAVAAGGAAVIYQTVAVGAGAQHTCSFWLKGAVGGEQTYVYVTGSAGGAGVGATRVTLTTEWARYSATSTPTGNPVYCVLGTNTALPGMTATSGGTIYAWGATLTNNTQNGDTLQIVGGAPYASGSPFAPGGHGTGRRFVGPYTDANYFSLFDGAVSDPLDSTGDRWGIVAFSPSDTSTVQLLYMNGGPPGTGHRLGLVAGGTFEFQSFNGSARLATSANTAPMGGLSVGCWWRTGNNISVKLNGGATVTTDAVAAEVSGTNAAAKIGRYETAGAAATTTTIAEMVQGLGAPAGYASPEAWCIDQTTKALAQGDPNMPLFTPPSNAILTLRGDDYTGGPYWPGPLASGLEVGTVGYSDAHVPALDGSRNRGGYGPFSATASLKLTGGGALNFPTSTGSICWVYRGKKTGSAATVEALGGTGSFNVSGWQFTDDGTMWGNGTGVNVSAALGSGLVNDGLNVVCAGMNAGKAHGKANLAAFGSSAGTITYVVPTTDALIGGYSSTRFMSGSIYEVWASSEAPSEALFTKVAQRVLARSGATTAGSQTVSNTRSTWQALDVPRPAGSTEPVLYMLPTAVSVAGPKGIGSWRTKTNALQASRSACTTGNVQDPNWTFYQLTCANDVTTGPDGRPADQFTQLLVNGGPYQTRNHPSTTTVSTASVYGKMTGATAGYISVMARGVGLMTTCTCSRSDNGPCTAVPNALATTDCGAKALIPPGQWVRLSATVTTDTTNLASTCAYYPGEIGVSTNSTAYLANFQCEAGAYSTPWIETTTTSAQRNGDLISSAMPADFAYANLAQNSEAICSAPWAVSGSSCSQTTTGAFGPFTGYSTLTTTGSNQYQTQVVTLPATTTGPFTATWWAQRGTNPGAHSGMLRCGAGNATAASCSTSDGTACSAATSTTDAFFHIASMPADPVKITATFSCTSSTTTITARLYGGYFNLAGTTRVNGFHLAQAASAVPYLKSTNATAYSDQKWCVRAVGSVDGGVTWTITGAQRYLWSMGTLDATNTVRLRATSSSRLTMDHYDSTGALTQIQGVHGYADGSSHTLDVCRDGTTITLYSDGVQAGTVTSNLWVTTPTLFYTGAASNGDPFDGWVRARVVKGVTTPREIDNLFGK